MENINLKKLVVRDYAIDNKGRCTMFADENKSRDNYLEDPRHRVMITIGQAIELGFYSEYTNTGFYNTDEVYHAIIG